jgi:hypothetical protein
MIRSEELIDLIEFPKDWLDQIWINHSDVPCETKPTTFRCGDPEEKGFLPCGHNFTYDDGGSWNPHLMSEEWAIEHGYFPEPTEEVQLEEHFVWIPDLTSMRKIWVGQCSVCKKIHYYVEREPEELAKW